MFGISSWLINIILLVLLAGLLLPNIYILQGIRHQEPALAQEECLHGY